MTEAGNGGACVDPGALEIALVQRPVYDGKRCQIRGFEAEDEVQETHDHLIGHTPQDHSLMHVPEAGEVFRGLT